MEVSGVHSNRFVLLCDHERWGRYENELSTAHHDVEHIGDGIDVLTTCNREPPLAVIIDMASGRGRNNESLVALTNLELAWPILRCRAKPDGSLMVISTTPINRAPLLTALEQIEAGDPTWFRNDIERRKVRVPVQIRARARLASQEQWLLGTILDLGAGGCFVHTFEPFEIGEAVVVEIRDLYSLPFELTGFVTWARTWDQGTKLPGIGIAFDGRGPIEHLVDALMGLPLLQSF